MKNLTPASGREAIQPIPASYAEVEVSVGVNDMLKEFSQSLWNYAKSQAGYGGFPKLAPSASEIESLLRYLTKKRCEITVGSGSMEGADKLLAPTFFLQGLSQIGVLNDRATGLAVRPKYVGPEPVSAEEAKKIAARLQWLSEYLHLEDGGVKGENYGDRNLMLSGVVGNDVLTRSSEASNIAPVYAAFFGFEQPEGLLTGPFIMAKKYGTTFDVKLEVQSNISLF